MRIIQLLFLACSMLFIQLTAHAQIRVSGLIKDASNGERLIGATVLYSGKGTLTDNNGFFSLSLAKGDSITFSYVGYATEKIYVSGRADTLLEINLLPGTLLGQVEVKATRIPGNNVATLSPLEIQSLPSISGKPDVMRAMQLLPGIMTQSEGSSLLLVRGGNPGENMYLFDHVPLIYVNHLGGFMSVFNPEIINSLDLYKGAFPARYGGKLSSIVNITQREGNNSQFKGSYHLGLTDLSLTFEGPLSKNTSFIVTGRKTVFDLLMLTFSSLDQGNDAKAFYGFHDINAKVSWRPDTRNSFHFNIFQGDDYWNFMQKKKKNFPDEKSKISYIWGNWMLSAGWKHIASPRLFVENNIAYTRYRNSERQRFSFGSDEGVVKRNSWFMSSVDMLTAVSAWKYLATDNWKLNFGLNSSYTTLLPAFAKHSHQDFPIAFSKSNTLENALYLENHFTLPWQLELTAGIRGVHYMNGSFQDFKAEPRLVLQRNLAENHQVNLSYMHVNQYSHLLFAPGSLFSNEVWIPAGNHILPSKSNQYTLGWAGSFAEGNYLSEANLYYKTLTDLATYKEGFVNLKGDANWQSKVESGGKGEAWGAEFMLRKTKGTVTGFVSYIWSRAIRIFPEINKGLAFPFDFDRPHSISLSVSHHFNKRTSLHASWVYQTGLPYTPVMGRQLIPSLDYDEDGRPLMYEAYIYGQRNSSRMKDYHRLDISYTINRYSADKLYATWTLGLYNAYNRKNPVYYYFNTSATGEIINPESSGTAYKPFALYQLSLFPIIPNVSYKYYFNQKAKTIKPPIKERLKKLLYHE